MVFQPPSRGVLNFKTACNPPLILWFTFRVLDGVSGEPI